VTGWRTRRAEKGGTRLPRRAPATCTNYLTSQLSAPLPSYLLLLLHPSSPLPRSLVARAGRQKEAAGAWIRACPLAGGASPSHARDKISLSLSLSLSVSVSSFLSFCLPPPLVSSPFRRHVEARREAARAYNLIKAHPRARPRLKRVRPRRSEEARAITEIMRQRERNSASPAPLRLPFPFPLALSLLFHRISLFQHGLKAELERRVDISSRYNFVDRLRRRAATHEISA